jgi:peptidoglycan/xylan/chitin deacetylase (PgdA/CDA1 family)
MCPVCCWEDDDVQLRYPGMRMGANHLSLREYQEEVLRKHPVAERRTGEWARDPSWRPLRDDECVTEDAPRSGLEYFKLIGKEVPPYYWALASNSAKKDDS